MALAAEDIDLMDLARFVRGEERALFAELRAADPVHWNDEGGSGKGFWSLTRYADVKAGAEDALRLSSADGTQIVSRRVEGKLNSLHNMDDPEHAKLRRITAPDLRPSKVRGWQGVVDDVVSELLDDAEAADEFDLVDMVAARLPMLIVAQVLGVPREDAPQMVDWANRMQSADPDHLADETAMQQARDEAMDYFRALTDKRREDPKDDLISVMAGAQKDGAPLTWEQLAAYYVLFVAAGNETTRHLISGGTIELDADPVNWMRMKDDPSLVTTAVEEMFRHVTPVSCMRRTATKDITLHGKDIAAGDKVVLWFSSANWDETVFDDPQAFRIDRTPNEHLTFGWGSHFCLGAHLARAEIRALYNECLRRNLRLEVTGDPIRLRHNLFRGWTHVPAKISRIGA
ncbi:cytochrome P450 [Intrasporangium chromatireducens Q5-1]|uniref:Cytochrome P450 n=1 Tax=Intrasporangium chromatireducens Q5-1 TaxID=584657 RepID=W9GJW2_9MICO|nr:cytochrome P450 [Intrasporangium chromatireducens]EWT06395.1 cytochrome P450 [Intrasporangium chromatireducens Q5-1]